MSQQFGTSVYQLSERFVYDAYGQSQVLDTSWSVTTDSFGWQYLYQGGRFDSATGLYDVRNRLYSPTMMRWMTQDPLGYIDGVNVYRAMEADPINHVDPLGLRGPIPTQAPVTTPTQMGGGYGFDGSSGVSIFDLGNMAADAAGVEIPPPPGWYQDWVTNFPRGLINDWNQRMDKRLDNLAGEMKQGWTPVNPYTGKPDPKPQVPPAPPAKPPKPPAGEDCSDPCDDPPPLPDGPNQGNHVFPRALSGGDIGPIVPIPRSQHTGAGASFHNDLNAWLERHTDGQGNSMRPKKGNRGDVIRENFTPEEILNAMDDFYNSPCGQKWPKERDAYQKWRAENAEVPGQY